MKLSEQLRRNHESGDFGKCLDGYAERAELLEKAMEWQPIETAPKDGTKFLALYGEDECFTMYWLDIPDSQGLFVYSDELLSDVDPSPEAPAHWMPLPQPPKE